MKLARIALACIAAGCAAAPSEEKGYSVIGRDPFMFEVDRQKLREWGGPNSPQFNRVLEEELERQKICRKGYTLRNEHLGEETFTVTGRCRS